MVMRVTDFDIAGFKPVYERQVACDYEISSCPCWVVIHALIGIAYIVIRHVKDIGAGIIIYHNGFMVRTQPVKLASTAAADGKGFLPFQRGTGGMGLATVTFPLYVYAQAYNRPVLFNACINATVITLFNGLEFRMGADDVWQAVVPVRKTSKFVAKFIGFPVQL